ncbi:nucleotidyltransferase domain-containing protein [Micromonospora sp. NPDC049175]|uniref:nucleotidyltransferase domain-containing protein n=1 Tax=Micromonospora sp. NPDC049175 TaxID=3364266 RepID=UPI0037202FBE
MTDVDMIRDHLRKEKLLPDSCLTAYIGGSFARGWHNEASDADVYVVSEEAWAGPTAVPLAVGLEPGHVLSEQTHVGALRCDVEYWTSAQVDQLFAKMSWEALRSGAAASTRLSVDESFFLERVGHAVALDGAEWLAERQAALRASAYVPGLVIKAFNMTDGYAEDAAGQLGNGDTVSAVLSARLAFNHAVEGLLAHRGEYGNSPKWRARRFQAADPPELSFEEYWALETMRSFDADHPEQWIVEVITVSRRLQSLVPIG